VARAQQSWTQSALILSCAIVPDPPDRGAISLPRQNQTYRFCRSQAIADEAAAMAALWRNRSKKWWQRLS